MCVARLHGSSNQKLVNRSGSLHRTDITVQQAAGKRHIVQNIAKWGAARTTLITMITTTEIHRQQKEAPSGHPSLGLSLPSSLLFSE